MKGVFDANILIDYLKGEPLAKMELTKFNIKIISIITWMEVLVRVVDAEEERLIKNFLCQFQLAYIDREISEIAIKLKREKKINLPDAIIWAIALKENALLITRNIKDFPSTEASVRVPY